MELGISQSHEIDSKYRFFPVFLSSPTIIWPGQRQQTLHPPQYRLSTGSGSNRVAGTLFTAEFHCIYEMVHLARLFGRKPVIDDLIPGGDLIGLSIQKRLDISFDSNGLD